MHITRVPIITFTDMKQSCSANEHHMFCLSFVCLFVFKNGIIRFEADAFKLLRNFYDVNATSAENVALVTVTSQKQNAVFGKVIICPCVIYM